MLSEEKKSSTPVYKIPDHRYDMMLYQAGIHLMHGDDNLAMKVYEEVIGKEPGNVRALLCKADLLASMGDFPGALICFDTALQYHPEDAEVWYTKGMILHKAGNHEEGLACIRKGLIFVLQER